MIFGDIFALFLAQNFKTKILTAQKNLLLECLILGAEQCFDLLRLRPVGIFGEWLIPKCCEQEQNNNLPKAMYHLVSLLLINRPVVAGAVLQKPLLLFD